MAIHVVRSGETLWAISNFYGVSISSIVRDNGLMSIDYIVPGLALYIPENRTSLYQRYYQIKAGDQLWMLARRFQTSVEQIQLANSGIDPYQLTVGQILVIPSPITVTFNDSWFY